MKQRKEGPPKMAPAACGLESGERREGGWAICAPHLQGQPSQLRFLTLIKVAASLKVCPQENPEREVGSKVCFLPRMAGGLR